MSSKEAENLLKSDDFKALKNIKISGVMGMASYAEDKIQISKEFKTLKSTFERLKELQKNMSSNHILWSDASSSSFSFERAEIWNLFLILMLLFLLAESLLGLPVDNFSFRKKRL